MESTDAIIIGAGVVGLSAAAYLAQGGLKVIVMEQDHYIGGTAHVFKRNGFTFPAGPQSFTMPAYIIDSLCELGVREPLCFTRDCFQVRRGAMDVMISEPLREIAEQLINFFPEEREGIRAVINILEQLISALDVLKLKAFLGKAGAVKSAAQSLIGSWSDVSAKELMDSRLHDERLKDILG